MVYLWVVILGWVAILGAPYIYGACMSWGKMMASDRDDKIEYFMNIAAILILVVGLCIWVARHVA